LTRFKVRVGGTQPCKQVLFIGKGDDLMTIEERIQELRKRKGLSQEQLAEMLGVSRQAVSKWENGQSLPEVEKLITMGELFGVTIDYILKGDSLPTEDDRKQHTSRNGSQIVSAVALMLILIGIVATFGQLSDGVYTMDIYGGLILESVGIMLVMISWFLASGRALNKPLFIVNVLLAGILPSLLFSQLLLDLKPNAIPAFNPMLILVFAFLYLAMCGIAIYFTVIRKKKRKNIL